MNNMKMHKSYLNVFQTFYQCIFLYSTNYFNLFAEICRQMYHYVQTNKGVFFLAKIVFRNIEVLYVQNIILLHHKFYKFSKIIEVFVLFTETNTCTSKIYIYKLKNIYGNWQDIFALQSSEGYQKFRFFVYCGNVTCFGCNRCIFTSKVEPQLLFFP